MLAIIVIRLVLPDTELTGIAWLIVELPLIGLILVSVYRLRLIRATQDSRPESDSTA